MEDHSDCYFGHGVYADGICDEVRKFNEEMNQFKTIFKGIRSDCAVKEKNIHERLLGPCLRVRLS